MVDQYIVVGFIGVELLLVNFIKKLIEFPPSVIFIASRVSPKEEIRLCKSYPHRIHFEPGIFFATLLFMFTVLCAPTLSPKRNEYSPS